ncbi:MAG: hypothetical protein KatS3mg111_0413 [Pirellulaceae bacterium]|nr:MAG: hypothetical protein KatS3mg111_0413 [Pirellulaceae bacterium]
MATASPMHKKAMLLAALAVSLGRATSLEAQQLHHHMSDKAATAPSGHPLVDLHHPAQQDAQQQRTEEIGQRYLPPPALPPQAVRVEQAPVETGQSLDLPTLLSLACQNNPTLRQARLQISAELAKAQQAGLYPNPVLTYLGEQVFVDVPGDTDSPGEFQGAEVSQRIVTANKLRLSREKYLRRAHVTEHLATAQQFRVCNDVRIHFYRALAARQRVELHNELLKTAEDAAVTARELYNLGQAARFDVHKANVQLQEARLAWQRAEHDYRARMRELSALIGIDVSQANLEGELAETDTPWTFEEARQHLLSSSPLLLAARAKLDADRATIRREEVQWVPDLIIAGGPGYNFDAGETVANASVSLEIPLFDRNQGTIAQARADYQRQLNEIRRIELQLERMLAGVYRDYALAYEHSLEYHQKIVPEAEAMYRELLQSYKANRAEWPDVLEAHRYYVQARATTTDFDEQLRRSEVMIQGFLLHDGLMPAEGATPAGHIDAVPKPR